MLCSLEVEGERIIIFGAVRNLQRKGDIQAEFEVGLGEYWEEGRVRVF
jgi:hypothetical protein